MSRIQTTTPRFEGAVRRDFFDPKPSRPAKQPTDWRTVALTAIIATAVVSTEAIVAWKPPSRPAPAVPSNDEIIQRPGGPVNPRPAPVVPPAPPAPVEQPAPEPLVLRAQPVEPVVRRGLPVEGQLYLSTMPDGRNLLVRYMGSVRDFDGLPKNPNLYDLYQVASSGHSWVFMMSPAIGRPSWIDP
jgi:hypothetical protein